MTGISLEWVSKRFRVMGNDELIAVEDFSCTFASGSFTALIGPSGCGKSTLLRMLQGLDIPDGGAVAAPGGENPGRVATMFQQPSLLPWRTVIENVRFGLELKRGRQGVQEAKVRAGIVDDLLELTGLAPFRDFYPVQLSGGMRQRVNLARALAVQPDVLLLDEPFSALDAMTRERLQVDVTRIIEAVKTTAILVTHDLREAIFLADRVVVLSPRPARIVKVVDVPFPRPRSADLQHSPEVADLVNEAWVTLHGAALEEGSVA